MKHKRIFLQFLRFFQNAKNLYQFARGRNECWVSISLVQQSIIISDIKRSQMIRLLDRKNKILNLIIELDTPIHYKLIFCIVETICYENNSFLGIYYNVSLTSIIR